MSSTMSIGIALVGSGIFAKTAHLPAIAKCPQLKLVAVYSRSLKSAQSLEAVEAAIYSEDAGPGKTYEDLLKSKEVVAVIIALPILAQPEYIRKALLAGKHVLSEKPIAASLEIARELVTWYRGQQSLKASWSVGENDRFTVGNVHAAAEAKKLGKLLGFHVRQHRFVKTDGKYYLTPWRKEPSYQGGFLLDGGIHDIAVLRLLLGSDDTIARISAFTAQLQPHLPPIDTLTAIAQTRSGVSGTISISFGTTLDECHFTAAYEQGTVSITRDSVTVSTPNGTETTARGARNVDLEVAGWAHGLESGREDPRLSPEEGLRDLEVLEAMFDSGEKRGEPIEIHEVS